MLRSVIAGLTALLSNLEASMFVLSQGAERKQFVEKQHFLKRCSMCADD